MVPPINRDTKQMVVTFGILFFALIALPDPRRIECFANTLFTAFVFSPLLFWLLQSSSAFEGRGFHEISNPLRQAWSFYGDGLLLAPAIAVARVGWASNEGGLPWWSLQWWWASAMGIAGVAFGYVFQLADNRRYDPRALQGAAKWYHDRVLIPFFAGQLFRWGLPLLWRWDVYALIGVIFVSGWIFLAGIDGIRMINNLPRWMPRRLVRLHAAVWLDPEDQHPRTASSA